VFGVEQDLILHKIWINVCNFREVGWVEGEKKLKIGKWGS